MNRFLRIFVALVALAVSALPFGAAAQGAQPPGSVIFLPIVENDFLFGPLTYSSSFQVQGLDDADAPITIAFYDQAGNVVRAVADTIPAFGSKTYFAVTAPGLASPFVGSAVISSEFRLRAIHNLAANDFTFGASSSGYTEGAPEVNLPLIMRNNGGFNTWFAVQNAGQITATVNVVFTAGSVGNNYTHPAVTIAPFASHFFYQEPMTELSAKFVGSAKVTSDVPVVATVVEVGPRTLYAYDGFTAASPSFIAPLFQYYNAGFSSSIQVQNVGTEETTVTVQYTGFIAGNSCAETRTITAGAAGTYGLAAFATDIPESNCYAQNPGTAFIGSATVSTNSANQPLVAIVNQHNFAADRAAAYNAFRPEDGTSLVSVPLVMDRNGNYWTGITVYNAGDATASVTIDYTNSSSDLAFYLPSGETTVILNQGEIADQYVNGAILAGSSASTDKLLVIVNEQNLVASGDAFYVYRGFNY